jgi:TetR/AcrR family transcriptional regulator of autoinduction and epiphytic fitness
MTSSSPVEAGPTETDGRRARAERNRDAVVEAILDLICEGVQYPTADLIAERSGVSVRSVFRHFDDLESLYAAAVDRHSERIRGLFVPPPPGGSLAERIDALAARRSRLFEAMTPVRLAGERLRGRSAVIDERLAFARELLRDQVATLFEPELATETGSARRDLLDAVEAASSWSNWNLLRTEQGCSVARARAVMVRTLTGLLPKRTGS